MEKQRWGRRLVLVPCPLQGHINPMLQLGALLHANGFSITVLHTKFNFPNPDNLPDFTFLLIPDALFDRDDASSMDISDIISCLNISCKAPLRNSLAQIMEREKEDHGEKLPCVIYDGSMYCAEAVADELKLPTIMLRTTNASTFLTYYLSLQLQKDGYLPLQDGMSLALVPGLHPFRFKDLPIANLKNLEVSLQQMARTTVIRSSAVICNTTGCLEQSSLAKLQQQCKVPVFPIGPLHAIVPTASSSILKEDRSCIEWLNKQKHNSVLYVSLGSIASMNQNELREMAKGLNNSRQPFLWVLRPDSLLPEDFDEINGDKGLIVKWAPQREVLAHNAVGGFWSHCGWNSTLESICAGVPMICQPCFGDQRVNARLICHVWKVGLEMENSLVSTEIEKAIRRLMVEAEGQQLRQRVISLKEKIELCTQEDASFYNLLSELRKCILSC